MLPLGQCGMVVREEFPHAEKGSDSKKRSNITLVVHRPKILFNIVAYFLISIFLPEEAIHDIGSWSSPDIRVTP